MNNIKKAKFKISIRKEIKELMLIILGTAIMAIGVVFFLLPSKLSTGGVTGIGTILYYLFKIPLGATTIIINIPLFILAFIKVGPTFFKKSFLGTILLSFFLDYFENYKPLTQDRFLACIYGGILVGLGTALVFKVNASTGGSDLTAQILKSYNKDLRASNIIVMLDILIVVANIIVFKQIEIGLYSAIAIYIMGKVLDIVFEGIYFTKMMYIISDKYEEITTEIENQIERGVTGLYSKGMYKNKEKLTLLCVASRNESIKIKQIAKRIDPRAFIIVTNAREVFGLGFKK